MAMEKFLKIDNAGAPSNAMVKEFLTELQGKAAGKADDHSHDNERMADEGCPNHD